MRDTTMDLNEVAAELGVTIAEHTGGEKGRWHRARRVVSLRRDLGPVNRRCTLAHELGHAALDHEVRGDLPRWIVVRQDKDADEWAARLLISEVEYAVAESIHPAPSAIARELEVTLHLLEVWQRLHERIAA